MPRAAADGPGEPGGADRLVGVETNAVSAWFGTHKVLERVSLTMRAGEVTALIGPLGCGLKPAGVKTGKAQRDHLVESSLIRAGLWGGVRNRVRTPGGALSGGQQQRLCVARSLAVSPDVLLMDEPCSALDPTSTRRVEETIAELRGRLTVAIVTHNMQQAQRVSQSCAFFLATHDPPGRIVEAGDTARMFSDPEDSRTADYVNGRFG